VYEAVLGRPLDKRNFRKKILALGLVEPVGETAMRGAHRPAMLYRFTSREPKLIDML
jgi:8-oxo-dGTP diphosphatase